MKLVAKKNYRQNKTFQINWIYVDGISSLQKICVLGEENGTLKVEKEKELNPMKDVTIGGVKKNKKNLHWPKKKVKENEKMGSCKE